MELVQLCMKKRGIRFFAKIPKEFENKICGDKYKSYSTKERFLAELAKREDEYDMILIAAHGAENKIIVPITESDPWRHEHPGRSFDMYRPYLDINDTHYFKNDFVFAVSCLTAQEFGPAVVKKGVITYLGYEVLISHLFSVDDVKMSSRVRQLYEIVAKRIFVQELVLAITEFLDGMHSVLFLKQWFALRLEKRLVEFFAMNTDKIYDTYGIKINQEIWDRNRQKLQIQQLDFLGEMNKHLVIIGDPNYISLYALENGVEMDSKNYDRLRKVSFENKDYEKKFKEQLEYLVEVQNEKKIY